MYLINGKQYHSIIWMLDNGHGKNTKGKRSPVWPDGSQLLEYEYTRDIVKRVDVRCNATEFNYNHTYGELIHTNIIVPELYDVSISRRARRANKLARVEENSLCIYLSIHGDAFKGETAHGTTIYTSPGYTISDDIADIFQASLKANVKRKQKVITTKAPEVNHSWFFRSNKEARFGVLTKTISPALLLETGFYTNYIECKYMMSDKGRDQISDAIIQGMVAVQNHYKVKK